MREELALRPARALALVEALPPEAAFVRSFTAGHKWTATEELLLQQLDMGQIAILVAMAAAGVKKHKLPRFHAAQRPFTVDLPKKRRRKASVEEMAEHLGGLFAGSTPS